jgi:hypothetical protein
MQGGGDLNIGLPALGPLPDLDPLLQGGGSVAC